MDEQLFRYLYPDKNSSHIKWILKPTNHRVDDLDKRHVYNLQINIKQFPIEYSLVNVNVPVKGNQQFLTLEFHTVNDDGICCTELQCRKVYRLGSLQIDEDKFWAFVDELCPSTLHIGMVIKNDKVNNPSVNVGKELISQFFGLTGSQQNLMTSTCKQPSDNVVGGNVKTIKTFHTLQLGQSKKGDFDHLDQRVFIRPTTPNLNTAAHNISNQLENVHFDQSENANALPKNPETVINECVSTQCAENLTDKNVMTVGYSDISNVFEPQMKRDDVDEETRRSAIQTIAKSESARNAPESTRPKSLHPDRDNLPFQSSKLEEAVSTNQLQIKDETTRKPGRKVAGDLMKLMSKFTDKQDSAESLIGSGSVSQTVFRNKSSTLNNPSSIADRPLSVDSFKRDVTNLEQPRGSLHNQSMPMAQDPEDKSSTVNQPEPPMVDRSQRRRASTITPVIPQLLAINGETCLIETSNMQQFGENLTTSLLQSMQAEASSLTEEVHNANRDDTSSSRLPISKQTKDDNTIEEPSTMRTASYDSAEHDNSDRLPAVQMTRTSDQMPVNDTSVVEQITTDEGDVIQSTSKLSTFTHPYEELDECELISKFNEATFNSALNKALTSNEPDVMRITLDVSEMKPEQLKMSIVGNDIHVDAHVGQLIDGTSKVITKIYHLPMNADFLKSTSLLTSQGILQIDVPLKTGSKQQQQSSKVSSFQANNTINTNGKNTISKEASQMMMTDF